MSSILTNFFYRKSYKKLENNFFKNWYKTDIFVSKCCQVKSKWQISFEQLSFQRQQFNLPRVCNKNEAIFMRSNHARVSWELKYTIFENSQKKKVSFDFDFFLIFPFDNSRFFRHFLKSPKWDIFQWFSYPVKLWMVVVDEIPSITWPWPKETFFIRFSYNPWIFTIFDSSLRVFSYTGCCQRRYAPQFIGKTQFPLAVATIIKIKFFHDSCFWNYEKTSVMRF